MPFEGMTGALIIDTDGMKVSFDEKYVQSQYIRH